MILIATFAGALLATTAPALPGLEGLNLAATDKVASTPASASMRAGTTSGSTADPIVLINQAAVEARMGRVAEARRLLQIAVVSQDRYDVELPDGRWMDSRQVARIALSRLSDRQPIVMR